MYLIDTNIFLEILLHQSKSHDCKNFLNQHMGLLSMTDFSLHSIGVILFRQNADEVFTKFLHDTLPKVQLLSLPKNQYSRIVTIHHQNHLDFDDTYQYCVCKFYGLTLVTMDHDFKAIDDIDLLSP